MTVLISTATANAALTGTGVKEQFTACFIYIFSGAVPATADAALDMVSTHTELVKISVGGDGVTGLNFGTAADRVLPKAPAEAWSGTNTFDGANEGTSPQAPTFFRVCAAGDDGRGAANTSTGYRLQGTVGGPGTGRDMVLGTATLTDGNTQNLGDGYITLF